MDGWIKLHRSILGWRHFGKPSVHIVFEVLLLKASVRDCWDGGERVRRGETMVSVTEVVTLSGLSRPTVLRCLATLEASGEIVREARGRRMLTRVVNYCKYQEGDMVAGAETAREASVRLPFEREMYRMSIELAKGF